MVNRFMTSGDPAPRGNVRAERNLLRHAPSFENAPKALIEDMVEIGHVVGIRQHWPLLAEQTSPDKAYILLDGEVDARRAGKPLGVCRPGEILGELGIVNRRLRSATIITSTPATLLHLERWAFEEIFDGHRYFRDLVGEAVIRKSA